MQAKVNYTNDWMSEDGMDQRGRITIEPESGGHLLASWECRGGKGRGCDLLENTTTEWTDEVADRILDSPGLSQGIGEFIVDISTEETWPDIELVEWLG